MSRFRAETNWVRMPGVFASSRASAEQLRLPVEEQGVRVMVRSTGQLRINPDFDIIVWLGEQWLLSGQRPGDDWVHFSYYGLQKALTGDGRGGYGRKMIRESLARLMGTVFTVDGWDAIAQAQGRRVASTSAPIIAMSGKEDVLYTQDVLEGFDKNRFFGALKGKPTVSVQLAPWITGQLHAENYTLLDWSILRELDGIAKKTWAVLCAQGYPPPEGDRLPQTRIALAPPAMRELGAGAFKERRKALKALKDAARRIMAADPSFVDIDVWSESPRRNFLKATRSRDFAKRRPQVDMEAFRAEQIKVLTAVAQDEKSPMRHDAQRRLQALQKAA